MKRKQFLLVLVLAAVVFNGIRLLTATEEQTTLESDTVSYLEEQGYGEQDIEELTIVNMGQEETLYAAVVTFKDEPETDYFYTYQTGTGQIYEIDRIEKE